MEPERIEEILQTRFPDDEPEGMRRRILERVSRVLRPARPRRRRIAQWALACSIATFVVFANVSDNMRQARICQADHGRTSRINSSAATAMMLRQRLAGDAWALDEDWRKPL